MSSPPDVIATAGTPVLAALKQATRSIPIVFSVVNDPGWTLNRSGNRQHMRGRILGCFGLIVRYHLAADVVTPPSKRAWRRRATPA